MSDTRFKECVFLVKVPDDFDPIRSWTPPETATELRLHARGLSLEQAAGFTSVFNAERLESRQRTGEPIGEWAIFSKFVKPKRLRYDLRRRLTPTPKRIRDDVVTDTLAESEGGAE